MIATLTSERIAVRFGVTLAANVARAGLSFLGGVIVARTLGASEYGDLNFLLASFAALTPLLEMGSSSAFYTFISERPRSPRFFAVYLAWLGLQFVVALLIVGVVLPASVVERVWVGHDRGIVLFALATSFVMTQTWNMVTQLGEALRKTALVQAAWLGQAGVHLVLVALAVSFGWLTVWAVMGLLLVEHLVLVAAFTPRLLSAHLKATADRDDDGKTIITRFAAYCAPLLLYVWVGVVYGFADRWLLQRFGGAEQQGFFAVAQQFSAISLLATTSVIKVFWKEVAEARAGGDETRVQGLFRSTSRGLYGVGAWTCCLLVPYTGQILGWTLGSQYVPAALAVAIMLAVPLYQGLGQVGMTWFYATGETARYTTMSVVIMALGIPLTYVALAPRSMSLPGLELGAVGLAGKTLLFAVVGVVVQTALITGWRVALEESRWQSIVLGLWAALGFLTRWVGGSAVILTNGSPSRVGQVLAGASLYLAGSLALLWRYPAVFGFEGRRFSAMLRGEDEGLRRRGDNPTAPARIDS